MNMCTNRLVQHGLQVRLQLFKTQNKGWGIRCLDDIAKGSFVCIYAGGNSPRLWKPLLWKGKELEIGMELGKGLEHQGGGSGELPRKLEGLILEKKAQGGPLDLLVLSNALGRFKLDIQENFFLGRVVRHCTGCPGRW